MAGSILGNEVRRTEDPELLTVGGRYVYDHDAAGMCHAVFVRSPVAHGRIEGIDTGAAASAPGVIAVFTADSLGVAPHHGFVKVADEFARAPLATGKVRFVGEAVAVVVAETLPQATDAAELVEVDYTPLPASPDAETALSSGAAAIFDERPNNVATEITDPPGIDPLAGADRIVRGRYVNQKIAAVPLEPNSCAAVPTDDGRMTIYCATQMPHLTKMQLAGALGWEPQRLRVIAPHVGGGFGAKAGLYHEHTVVAALADRLDRPVTWTPGRSEDMTTLAHSRAQVQYAELGVRDDGTFTGLRVRLVGDTGAYPNIGTMLPAGTKRMSNGTYEFPAIRFDVVTAVTNTTPTGAYRGAGRPEAAALLERLVDQAALETGIDPIELRMRNFISPDAFPFDTLTGVQYDSGDYALALRRALELAGYDELRSEQAARRERGDVRQLGIGIASFVEITAGGLTSEFAAVRIESDGGATIRVGTSAHGQGHHTTFAQIVSARTGIDVERIGFVQSDTDLVPRGGGTGGSRSVQVGGSAVSNATDVLVERAQRLAAHLLEASVADIVLDTAEGTFSVAGVPARSVNWTDLAAAVTQAPGGLLGDPTDAETTAVKRGEPIDPGLAAQLDFDQGEASFPFGAHVAVVEVDTDTGEVHYLRHIAVDDAGTVINPLLLAGQQHGGIAQGAAQTLYEEVVFDEDGNPQTGTLLTYLFPSAAEFPSFEVHSTQTPSPLNPLGAKGIGEASTIGSTPALQNAVIDAIAHLGVRHIDMPMSPQRVWETIAAARAGTLPDPWQEPLAIFAALAAGTEVDAEGLAAAESI
ncbi:xanthine dehydrogenase family protein molybdopterin-binding subunit [Candidatus Poriferisodalis sp.]|uniref:xanthine dehydrogenase family protein molybdopterin-binding subunit n=1 Tax=Candidatus Poriferisodalis sp. TaxID=3101277 RepID=UPI003D124417